MQIKRVVGSLRAGGTELDPANSSHIWPLPHARIIPNGTYFLGWPQNQAEDMVPSGLGSEPYGKFQHGCCSWAYIENNEGMLIDYRQRHRAGRRDEMTRAFCRHSDSNMIINLDPSGFVVAASDKTVGIGTRCGKLRKCNDMRRAGR